MTGVSTLKYPFIGHKQNCFRAKDQDRNRGGGHGPYLKTEGLHVDRTTPLCVLMHCSADSWLSPQAVCPLPKIWFHPIRPGFFSRAPGQGGGSEASMPKIKVNINRLK